MIDLDEDALLAAVNLVARSGASDFEVGFLNDDAPMEQADWWAKAQYRGGRLQVEHRKSPVEAAEALARELFKGATCTHCGALIRLSGNKVGCRWRRAGARWERGCANRIPEGDRKIESTGPNR